MILNEGDKVFIVHRRLYDGDQPRFFFGVVDGYETGLAKVRGHSCVKDPFTGAYVIKDDSRTKIFSLSSGTVIAYQLPDETALPSMRFEMTKDGRLWLTDGAELRMDISEIEHAKPIRRVS